MQLDRFVSDLRTQLLAAAEASSDETRSTAERLSTALDPAARLVLLELLSEAAGEITRELAPGSVEVRLRGRDPELVVSRPVAVADASRADASAAERTDVAEADADLDGASTSRTTLRLPDGLKARAEAAAAEAGISVNAWLVRAVAGALEPGARAQPQPATTKGSSLTGWIR